MSLDKKLNFGKYGLHAVMESTAHGHSLGRFSSQNIELVSQQEDFGFQRKPATEIAQPRRTRPACRYPPSGGSIVRFGFLCQGIEFPTGTGEISSKANLFNQKEDYQSSRPSREGDCRT